jgi:simple sugar transport system ATP-binding protein
MTLPDGSAATILRRRVAAVYQTPMLFERLSWEENLALAGNRSNQIALRLDQVRADASQRADELNFRLPPAWVRIAECAIAMRVRLEILRALSVDPRVLVLDEPTGVLAPSELASFLDLIRNLRSAGRIVILVTHKLSEALAVADRVTVLRAGRKVAELAAAETDERELAALMIGELPAAVAPRPRRSNAATILRVAGVTCEVAGRRVLDDLSLAVTAGEIVGIAGVEGNGQTELAALLGGSLSPVAGRIELDSRGGVATIAQDRDRDGLILDMTLAENLLLSRPLLRRFTARSGLLRRRRITSFCADLLDRFAIRAAGPAATAAALSGGNRQRLAVDRAFAATPGVIVAHDVCRGLDLRATAEVHRRLRDYAADGGAVILIASDLDELLTLADRVLVISRGRLTEVAADQRNPVGLGILMAGTAA